MSQGREVARHVQGFFHLMEYYVTIQNDVSEDRAKTCCNLCYHLWKRRHWRFTSYWIRPEKKEKPTGEKSLEENVLINSSHSGTMEISVSFPPRFAAFLRTVHVQTHFRRGLHFKRREGSALGSWREGTDRPPLRRSGEASSGAHAAPSHSTH